MSKYFIVLPTYNEALTLPVLIERIFSLKEKFNLIIVDDNSPDGTGKIADSFAKKFPEQIFVIHRQGKLGLGTAYIAGFEKALSLNADLIFSMDSDLSHDPKYLVDFLKSINSGADIVLGSRYIPGGSVNWTGARKFLSKGANLLAKSLLGINANDLTTGFRCYKANVLKSIDFSKIKSEGYSFLEEILFYCHKKGFVIKEIPITFINRNLGKSKLGKKEIFNFFFTIVKLKLKNPF